MLAPPLAHLGHWYVSLPVFMGPALLVVIALKLQTRRERRYGPDQSGKRSDNHISAPIEPEPAMDPLRAICAKEGVELTDEDTTQRSGSA